MVAYIEIYKANWVKTEKEVNIFVYVNYFLYICIMKNTKYKKQFDANLILKLNKEGNNISQIANIINIPARRLSEMIKQNELNIKKNFTYNVDDNFFENIDNELKAYILGYIIADGCISITKRINKKSYRLQFLSSIDDEYIIKLIKKSISPNSKIFKSNCQLGVKLRKKQLRLRLTSEKICKDLINLYGVTPNKTLNDKFKFPNIKNSLKKHLIRGVFDGDGHYKKGRQFQFCLNSHQFCEDIAIELQNNIEGIKYRIVELQGKTCKYYNLYINTGYGVADKISDYLYKDSKYYLNRKKF